jgi:hypothetical protein
MRLLHHSRLTIREIECGPDEVQDDAWNAIVVASFASMEILKLQDHMFVTVVGAPGFYVSEEPPADGEEADVAFAMYQQVTRHISIGGGQPPDEMPVTREEWLHELKVSTAHEFVHAWQEIQGTLTGSQENEDEADAKAREIVATLG